MSCSFIHAFIHCFSVLYIQVISPSYRQTRVSEYYWGSVSCPRRLTDWWENRNETTNSSVTLQPSQLIHLSQESVGAKFHHKGAKLRLLLACSLLVFPRFLASCHTKTLLGTTWFLFLDIHTPLLHTLNGTSPNRQMHLFPFWLINPLFYELVLNSRSDSNQNHNFK